MTAELVFNYFPGLSKVQKDQFNKLEQLYGHWNEQINVISRKDIDELYLRHVLHSLGIAKVINFKPETRILDVGTGGGFPGIPLAILFPEAQFHLVDSIGKKIKVVNAIVQELGLNNVSGTHIRAEQVQEKYHFVVSRAVTRLKPFYQWIKNKFEAECLNKLENGLLYLKGGDLTDELNETKKRYQLFHLSDFFEESFFETKKIVYIRSN
ncbi:MAG: 16S rRNA (guanine(527)-N(7))-methyltransferase RsmG [Bacteroidota bacterium]